jgi:uncharacterized membrane protein
MAALVVVGAPLSLALEYTHYRVYSVPSASNFCSLGARVDCASVVLSKYSVLLGVPVPLWGFAGFLAIGLALWQRSRWLLPLTALAALASVVLIAVSVVSVGALCLLCEGVHLVSFALFALAWRTRKAELVSLRAPETSVLIFAPPLGVLVALWLFLPAYWGAFSWQGDVPFAHGKTPGGDAWIGAVEPKLTVEEFVDYSCPHCRVATAHNLRRLAEHPNELRLVRRHFPSTQCAPRSEGRCLKLRVALCADEEDKFWQTDRWLFEHGQLDPNVDFDELARDVGLDRAALAKCVDQEQTFARAVDAWKRAKKQRIPGTPYYAVGDRTMSHADAASLIEEL